MSAAVDPAYSEVNVSPTPSTSSNPAAKRTVFGRKKKSAPSPGLSTSGTPSLGGGGSMESLDGAHGKDKARAVVGSVFKRKGRHEGHGDGSIGSIEEAGDGEDHGNTSTVKTSEDGYMYDSEPDATPHPNASDRSSPPSTSNAPSPRPRSPAPSNTTFIPYSNTTSGSRAKSNNSGNSLSANATVGKKSSMDILKSPRRRSTSPVPPENSAPKSPSTLSNLFSLGGSNNNSNANNQQSLDGASDPRPATSGGELRKSTEHGRRTGRSSVGASDANDISSVPPLKTVQDNREDRKTGTGGNKAWPPVINTKTKTPTTPRNTLSTTEDATPKTTVTPPTPTDSPGYFPPKSPVRAIHAGGAKRNRTNSLSNTPSKLNQSMTVPITPTSEGSALDGSSPNNSVGGNPGGFFQSMFSAAQNAATTLTNTLGNTNTANNNNGGMRSRSGTEGSGTAVSADENQDPSQAVSGLEERKEPQKQLAVETLGLGELSLGSLGIVTTPQKPVYPMEPGSARAATFSIGEGQTGGFMPGERAIGDGNDDSFRPISPSAHPMSASSVNSITPFSAVSTQGGFETAGESAFNSPSGPGGSGFQDIQQRTTRTPVVEDGPFISNSSPNRGDMISGDITPDRSTVGGLEDRDDWGGDGDRRRSGSVRSNQGTGIGRRKRGSSAASQGNTLQVISKPTGFAVASKKRNRDFHTMFRSVPEDDYLIEDYGCALQKEILLQGRLYVSEGHICFNSNIFGWVNTLVISFDEVVSVEKKSTAMVFPNAIVIQTLHARNVFASFISRDSTYELIVGIWKISHPQLVAGVSGVRLEEPGEGMDVDDGGSEFEEEDDEEYEDESDDDLGESYTDTGDGNFLDGRKEEVSGSKGPSRKTSQALGGVGAGAEGKDNLGTAGVDFPGPQTHAPTVCGDEDQHYDKILCDEIIVAPLGKLYSIIFGASSFAFMNHFLSEEEKVLELTIPAQGEWGDGPNGKKIRNYSYIRPLNNGIGPKQTKCNIIEIIESSDIESHVTVSVTTQTPDVPSGNVFSVKTRYCLMWGEESSTRLIASCTVEWTGKSWLKGPIEKGASDGQVAYIKNLLVALRTEVAPKEIIPKQIKSGNKKGKRRKGDVGQGKIMTKSVHGTVKRKESAAPPSAGGSWGILSPLKPYFGPIFDTLQSLLQGNMAMFIICSLLIALVVSQTKGKGTSASQDVSKHGFSSRSQFGGREEVWKSEEERLWEWLGDRVGLDKIEEVRGRRMGAYEKVLGGREVGQGIKQREMEEAIGIMEERLEVLKKVVEGRKQKLGGELAGGK